MDWITVLRYLQSDFINRLQSGHLLHCESEGQHSELTIISGERLKQLRKFCWLMAEKYKRFSPVRDLFISYLKGKLGEELVKERLGGFITEVDYEKRLGGDGNTDFTLTANPSIGIEVKSRFGQLDKVRWSVSSEEVEKNAVIVCVFIQEEVSEAQTEYHLFLAGFLPARMIKLKTGRIYFGIEQLLYGGGLGYYLEQLSSQQKNLKVRQNNSLTAKFPYPQTKDDNLIGSDEQIESLFVKLAEECLVKGEYDAAISHLTEALKFQPYNIDIHYKLANTRYELGDYAGAIADYLRIININPNHATAYSKSANARYYLGDYEGAIADYSQALKINPDDAVAYKNRAYVYARIGDNQRAIEDYTQALKISPHNKIINNKHDLDTENLLTQLENEATSNNALSYKNLGNFHYQLGDFQQAITNYTQAIMMNTNDSEAYYYRGNCRYELDDIQGAVEDYTQAIKINPNYADAYNHRGNCFYEQGNKQQAIQDLQKATDIYRKLGKLAEHKNLREKIMDLEITDSVDTLQF